MIGGRFGKVNGFNFYFQKNEKLKPCERRKLLSESDSLISKLLEEEVDRMGSVENVNTNISFLDSSHSDMELKEIWNTIYNEYGFRFDRFKDKWEKEFLGVFKDFGSKENHLNL